MNVTSVYTHRKWHIICVKYENPKWTHAFLISLDDRIAMYGHLLRRTSKINALWTPETFETFMNMSVF